MLIGAAGWPWLERLAPLMPALIFAMLLLTFCSVAWRDLRPRRLHAYLLVIQLAAAPVVYLLLRNTGDAIAQAVMICVLCPTATSAAVITSRLGGSAASVSTYTLLSNIGVALVAPLLFPLIYPNPAATDFGSAFSHILLRVVGLLICPLAVAYGLQRFVPRVHRLLARKSGMAFYLWAFSLTVVIAQIVGALINTSAGITLTASMAIGTLAVCCLQFILGKKLGSRYADRIAGGQSFGQKNTVLAIWMAHTYLHPLAATGPGFYVIWQNLINGYQLYRKKKKDEYQHRTHTT